MFPNLRAICLIAAAAFAALVPAQPANAAELLSNYRVLSVGIDAYPTCPLPGCVNDATVIAKLLSRDGFSSEGQAMLLTDGDATKANILSRLETLVQQAREEGSVALFFSGHGMRRGEHWYFVPYDFDGGTPETTALAGEEILKAIRKLAAKRCTVLLMLDACNAGEILGECEGDFERWRTPGTGGLIVLASSAASQFSKAGAKHSLFTQTLLEALSPKKDVDLQSTELTTRISLNEAKRYLSRRMQERLKNASKILGFDRSEQDFVADWSLSITDSVTLLEYENPKGRKPFSLFEVPEISNDAVRWRQVTRVVDTSRSVAGAWKATRTYFPFMPKMFGVANPYWHPSASFRTPPHTQTLLLICDDEGNYFVSFQDGSTQPITASGRYEFKPGSYFHLRYNTGFDSLGLASLTEKEMIIEYYPQPYWLVVGEGSPEPEQWVFQRIKINE